MRNYLKFGSRVSGSRRGLSKLSLEDPHGLKALPEFMQTVSWKLPAFEVAGFDQRSLRGFNKVQVVLASSKPRFGWVLSIRWVHLCCFCTVSACLAYDCYFNVQAVLLSFGGGRRRKVNKVNAPLLAGAGDDDYDDDHDDDDMMKTVYTIFVIITSSRSTGPGD